MRPRSAPLSTNSAAARKVSGRVEEYRNDPVSVETAANRQSAIAGGDGQRARRSSCRINSPVDGTAETTQFKSPYRVLLA
jgi:hypothetical protein